MGSEISVYKECMQCLKTTLFVTNDEYDECKVCGTKIYHVPFSVIIE